jgi:hypothetical protein
MDACNIVLAGMSNTLFVPAQDMQFRDINIQRDEDMWFDFSHVTTDKQVDDNPVDEAFMRYILCGEEINSRAENDDIPTTTDTTPKCADMNDPTYALMCQEVLADHDDDHDHYIKPNHIVYTYKFKDPRE